MCRQIVRTKKKRKKGTKKKEVVDVTEVSRWVGGICEVRICRIGT